MQRRRDIAIRPPAHIHELVERAGRENVFWTSARRPGRVPEPGNGAAELANGVVGSDLSATQGTPSAQPGWTGRSYELAGDDYVELQNQATDLSEGITVALVANSDTSTDFDYLFGSGPGDGSNFPRFLVTQSDTSSIDAVLDDSDGRGAFASVSTDPTTESVIVAQGHETGGEILTDLWVDGQYAQSTPQASTGNLTGVNIQRIGSAVASNGGVGSYWSGALRSAIVVPQALGATFIEDVLIPGIKQSWRL